MTTVLDTTSWLGVTGLSLWGASQVVSSVGNALKSTTVFVWNGVTRSATGFDTPKLVKELRQCGKDFGYGAGWVGVAFLARQVVARLFSPKAPAFVTSGLALLGWQQIRSPLVDSVVSRIERVLPFNITVY